MLIVSEFHDYYDVGASYGVDTECVFKRTVATETLSSGFPSWKDRPLWKDLISRRMHINRKLYNYTFDTYLVGYCGQLYPCIKVEVTSKPFVKVFYEKDHYLEFIKLNGFPARSGSPLWWRYGSVLDQSFVNHFFDKGNYRELESVFLDYKTPIFAVSDTMGDKILTINPRLKDYMFVSNKDAYTTFQDIYMYLSGVIGNTEKDIVQISDKDQLFKKGFDNNSFKTPKGAPERKRKKKT